MINLSCFIRRGRLYKRGVAFFLLNVQGHQCTINYDNKYLSVFPIYYFLELRCETHIYILTKTCLALLKMLFTWPHVRNAIHSTYVLFPQNLSTFSQSQVVYAHKQNNVRTCSPFQLYQTQDI